MELIEIDEAARRLGTTSLYLRQLMDVGNVKPSVIRLHDGQLWHEQTKILFSKFDQERCCLAIISFETVRCWAKKFAPEYAGRLRRKTPSASDIWNLDEVIV